MKRVTLALATAAVLAGSGTALAADAPKDVVEYRQSVMSALGGHAGAIARIVKQQVSYDHIQAHADAIAATAAAVSDIFPENSGPGDYEKTDALAKIWEQPDKFQDAVEQFQTAAQDFKAAAGGDRGEVIRAFKALGDSCGNCHDSYRAEN